MSTPWEMFTRSGALTPYAFRCGYIETNRVTGLVIWWQSCCYHVAGWLNPDDICGGVHVRRACRTLGEARNVARHPYSPAFPPLPVTLPGESPESAAAAAGGAATGAQLPTLGA